MIPSLNNISIFIVSYTHIYIYYTSKVPLFTLAHALYLKEYVLIHRFIYI